MIRTIVSDGISFLNPLLLTGDRIENRESMTDLVQAIERLSGGFGARDGREPRVLG